MNIRWPKRNFFSHLWTKIPTAEISQPKTIKMLAQELKSLFSYANDLKVETSFVTKD
jgi:hypothetical protein